MKIVICASSVFANRMVEFKEKLEQLGHKIYLHDHYIAQGKGGMKDLVERMGREHAKVKKEFDYLRYHYQEIKQVGAVLVLNFDRKGIKNYIGANTFLEIGIAHVLNKKIFILNNLPDQKYIKDEIEAIDPVVLSGNLTKIK